MRLYTLNLLNMLSMQNLIAMKNIDIGKHSPAAIID